MNDQEKVSITAAVLGGLVLGGIVMAVVSQQEEIKEGYTNYKSGPVTKYPTPPQFYAGVPKKGLSG